MSGLIWIQTVWGPDGQKTAWTVFLVLNLFYSLQRGSSGFITEETILFQGSSGGPTFFFWGGGGGGDPTFSKGVQMLISIETHITCDFPGGFEPPIPFGSAYETRGILIGCFALLDVSLLQNYLR